MPTQNPQDFAAQLYALLPLAITNGLRMLGAIAILLIGLWLAGKAYQVVIGMLGRTPHIDEMLKSDALRYVDYARMSRDDGSSDGPSLLKSIFGVTESLTILAAWLASAEHDLKVVRRAGFCVEVGADGGAAQGQGQDAKDGT